MRISPADLIKKANYSVLNEFTGLLMAALMAWKLTVNSAIATDTIPATINTPAPMVMLY